MPAKHEYVITLNACDGKQTPVVYDYGHVRDLELRVGEMGAQIRFRTAQPKAKQALLGWTDKLLQDAVRKALILYALHTGRPLEIRFMLLSIDGGQPEIWMPSEGEIPPVYSMLREFRRPLSPAWNDPAIFETLCRCTKSGEKSDSRFASLYALMLSKTKHFEIERFIYLWMSVNGFYAWLAQQVSPSMPLSAKGKARPVKSEEDRIRFLALACGQRYDRFIPSAGEKSLVRAAELALSNAGNWSSRVALEAAVSGIAKHALGGELPMDVETFLALWLPYKLRCKYFHAEQPVPMVCFRDEYLLRVITRLNDVIESFLDAEVPKWFGGGVPALLAGASALTASFALKNEMRSDA